MARFLHVADLHLSPREYDYSVGVLKEIVGAAAALDVDAILAAGHLATDLDAFADVFCRSTCEWLSTAGTVEASSGCPGVRVLAAQPFELHTCAGVEILALPHRNTYADYPSWGVPEKETRHRVALAHAPVLTLPSLASDAPSAVIDPELFTSLSVDYAALGSAHITCAPSRFGDTLMADPGSARVTTTNETGARGGFLIEIDDRVDARWIAFARAGQRRELSVPVATDGALPALDTDAWNRDDAIALNLTGVLWKVDPETVERRARELWGDRARRVDIDSRRLTPVADAKLAAVARRLGEVRENDETALRAREQSLALLVTAG